MRLFQKEAHFIREAGYENFKEYWRLWSADREYFAELPDDEYCKTITHRAHQRAMNQRVLADFLDPQGRYNFYSRRRRELGEE